MRYFITLAVTAYLALTGHALGAAFVWCAAIGFLHSIEETRGELWKYFGRITEADWLARTAHGWLLIVAPALVLQSASAWFAFMGDGLCVFWLSVLIGARIGDAVFSHAIPYANDGLKNPGLPTAALYLVDGVLMALLWHAPMMNAPADAIWGMAIGAGFFAAVLPGLRISKLFLD